MGGEGSGFDTFPHKYMIDPQKRNLAVKGESKSVALLFKSVVETRRQPPISIAVGQIVEIPAQNSFV